MTIKELLQIMVQTNASDLYITVDAAPMFRVEGVTKPYGEAKLTAVQSEEIANSLMSEKQKAVFSEKMEMNLSLYYPDTGRFRVNIFRQKGYVGIVFRKIEMEIDTLDDLRLPEILKDISLTKRGLVLLVGGTGTGKSTTLAAMIDIINRTRQLNIVTIEDPIEYLHRHKKSTVRQRELGADTLSFGHALRHVLRHDPDVILIGEMRDLESISIALTAAETGHLVFSTLHTQTAPLTINRVIDAFGESERKQIRQQLANTIQAVVSQQLMTKRGGGRVVAVEMMKGVPSIRNLIREGKEHQIYSVMQTGQEFGMSTMDMALIRLYRQMVISEQTLYENCIDHQEVERLLAKKPNQVEFKGDW